MENLKKTNPCNLTYRSLRHVYIITHTHIYTTDSLSLSNWTAEWANDFSACFSYRDNIPFTWTQWILLVRVLVLKKCSMSFWQCCSNCFYFLLLAWQESAFSHDWSCLAGKSKLKGKCCVFAILLMKIL